MFTHKACIVPTNERHVLEWLHIATEWKLMTWNCHGASRLTPVKPQAWLVTGRAKPIYHWIMHHLIKSGVTQTATNAKSLRTWPPNSSFPLSVKNWWFGLLWEDSTSLEKLRVLNQVYAAGGPRGHWGSALRNGMVLVPLVLLHVHPWEKYGNTIIKIPVSEP